MTLAIAAAAVFLVLPLIVFRGRTLRRWLAFEVLTWLFAAAVAPQVTIDPYLAVVLFFTAKLAAFAVVLASAREVRWSANRAAAVAGLVYALMIPAMLRTPIDGDEPYYVLITDSLLRDHDLDLRNQYRDAARITGRADLVPQPDDPTGPRGEQFSRHEPFLPLLMIPGYAAAGLLGALATIALFGVLLTRSTIRMLEDEGIPDDVARAVFPFFALAPPVIFYAARVWPEVPGAWLFVEALRGVRQRRMQRWLPALFALVLLKLRFVLIGAPLAAAAFRRRRSALVLLLLVALPAAIVWWISGSVTNVHRWRELLPYTPDRYAIGLAGLLVDGAAGIAFQAPFYLLGIAALTRWRRAPEGFRLGILASLLYILYLVPRSEWHGGWSPPLRYIVFLMPILALGAASIWERVPRGVIAIVAAWTVGLVAHGVAYPYRLFHIANGENAVGEWLSTRWHSDFSRLFPSFIRINEAGWIGVAVLIVVLAVRFRSRVEWEAALATLLIALFFHFGRQPAARVEFEDAHVIHRGGELYPEEYTVARFNYRGGWLVREGDSLSFLARAGNHEIEVRAPEGAALELAGRRYDIEPTGEGYVSRIVTVPAAGRVELRCIAGGAILDRMTLHD